MKFFASLISLFALFAVSAAARADTIFNVQGTFQSGATLSGTLTSNGHSFDDLDLTVTSNGKTYDFTHATAQITGILVGNYDLYSLNVTSLFSSNSLDLFLPLISLSGFDGSAICSTNAPCPYLGQTSYFNLTSLRGSSTDFLTDGSITPLSVTPEPSSILLLGTGLLGMGGIVRRRYIRA